jgi:hypothetical protein
MPSLTFSTPPFSSSYLVLVLSGTKNSAAPQLVAHHQGLQTPLIIDDLKKSSSNWRHPESSSITPTAPGHSSGDSS